MDAVERLTLEEADAPSLLALTHVHRYEVAAEICAGLRVLDLCCGSGYGTRILARSAASVTGVDIHEPSIERARAALGDSGAVSFEVADALEYLERDLAGRFDAIVLLEGLEHLPEPTKVIELLRAHARAGAVLFVSIPNEGSFPPEDKQFHLTEFEYEDVIAIIDGLDGAQVFGQSHAEGSLISAPDAVEAGPVQARLTLAERAAAQHFNHYLLVANIDEHKILGSSHMQLTVAPTFHGYMLDLERENRALWHTNARLARERLGVADSAAAAALDRIDELEGAKRLPLSTAADRSPAKAAAQIVLNILPHAVTIQVTRYRERARLAAARRAELERSGLPQRRSR